MWMPNYCIVWQIEIGENACEVDLYNLGKGFQPCPWGKYGSERNGEAGGGKLVCELNSEFTFVREVHLPLSVLHRRKRRSRRRSPRRIPFSDTSQRPYTDLTTYNMQRTACQNNFASCEVAYTRGA